ncbi:MAG: hypothetical protein CVU38_19270 [Chloroflexi bacterium HGW-Chloroflexi-1]|nr:MAG: hypothetical protein CVU38_19270 [Chloroflexi bacterium HGW-Chloroflexi-1]
MKMTGIIWLEDIVDKLEREHAVWKHEVKEVFTDRVWFRFVEKGHRPGENLYSAFGQTEAGRYVIVFFVHKRDGQALVISAREMTETERKTYERQ